MDARDVRNAVSVVLVVIAALMAMVAIAAIANAEIDKTSIETIEITLPERSVHMPAGGWHHKMGFCGVYRPGTLSMDKVVRECD